MKQAVVVQFPYAAVKAGRDNTFDIWTWNVYKVKWTRMNNHGCGFSSAADAAVPAKLSSDETAAMLLANRTPPPPCP